MPTASKKTPTKKTVKKKSRLIKKAQASRVGRVTSSLQTRTQSFLARRPHRSFRITRRRDAVRPLALPGNIAFTAEVTRTLWKHKRLFLSLGAVYVIFYGVLVGMQSQSDYNTFSQALSETGEDLFSGNWGAVGQAGVLLATIASTNLGSETTDAQQILAVLIFLLTWLTTVWLLRNILAGHKVKLRDGLYSSAAPLFAMIVVAAVIVVQLLPVALAALGYSAAASTGLLEGGAAAMLFWLAAGFLAILSLFWITSSLFAMVIVTLPGMYPFKALGVAGDVVLGRRVPILLRWLWMMLAVLVAAAVVMIPIILLDMGLKNLWPVIEWLPIVPFTFLVFAAFATIWAASYVYLFYRKVVDNDR